MQRPPQLLAGDKVVIVSPSRQIESSQLDQALKTFQNWGLEPKVAEHALSKHGYFAGNDGERLSDLQLVLDDPEVKAVFCARGGYGMTRIIDEVDLSTFIKNPKWVIGFSDITALHLLINKNNIESIHGLMPVQFEYDGIEKSSYSLKKILFEGELNYNWKGHSRNLKGVAKGQIIGGNLSLLVDSIGTKNEINTDGKILFIEEIDEYYYKIDRMLTQLKRAGKFDTIAGLIVGQFSDLKDTQIKFGSGLQDIVLDKVKSSVPVCFNAPIGHEMPNLAIPCGREVNLSVSESQVNLLG
ncbi:S66 peptidase family protein [Fulvivirga lutea]|uniref:LD-carboxypeptidase n=1 Tax=Fulvivirga lutea TaxID=2810512 RepID=A0A974WJY5_9BACT|nr:LD-carboxypeptidase [Fulvivirga lutea]QSE98587.1 LD-carboxypeptidase [Fulvivirga lutea]